MPTNSECHLQFLVIHLLCMLCHIGWILPLTKPVCGPVEMDREWQMLNALFEGQILSSYRLPDHLAAIHKECRYSLQKPGHTFKVYFQILETSMGDFGLL